MSSLKSDFPIFASHPDIVYLDNTASVQKPRSVIDAISSFFASDYANIHRGTYDLAERSETLYHESKEAVRDLIGASSTAEISYHYNATYALNFLSLSLAYSGILTRGDRILLSAAEHHANIVPWLILKKWFGVEVDFCAITEDYSLDLADLQAKITPRTKVISLTYASNVTGAIFPLEEVGKILAHSDKVDFSNTPLSGRKTPLFFVDASQAVPNFRVDVAALGCDALFFTGHKMMSDTGIGVLWGRKDFLKILQPAIGGGGAINFVTETEYAPAGLPEKMEPGTPHIAGAVSLLAAIRYMQSIGSYEAIESAEKPLIEAMLALFVKLGDKVILYGPKDITDRIGVFSFSIPGKHPTDIADAFADAGICVRAGFHCAEPLAAGFTSNDSSPNPLPTVRASLYFYNDMCDVERFSEVLQKLTL